MNDNPLGSARALALCELLMCGALFVTVAFIFKEVLL